MFSLIVLFFFNKRYFFEISLDLIKGDLEGVSEDLVGNGDEEEVLWLKVEFIMKVRE